MMYIAQRIAEIKKSLPEDIKLVAVSKTKSPDIIMEAYGAGHKIFGENKVQEMVRKYEVLPKDIEWHFIGHLQSNKVKYIVQFVSMIHGIDSLKVLKQVNKEAVKTGRIVPCLLQFHIARESAKFGLNEDEAHQILRSDVFKEMKNVTIAGVMGMATFTDYEPQVRSEFSSLKMIFEKLKKEFFFDSPEFREISMGMSGDYKIAIDEGSTIVRIGSNIFGPRDYYA